MSNDRRLLWALACGSFAALGAACTASAPAVDREAPPPAATEATPVVTLPAPAPREERLEAAPTATSKVSPVRAPASMGPADAKASAPAVFTVAFETSKGLFSARCHKAWAPKAADRLFNLVELGYFDDTIFFRVITKPSPFVVQWGIHGSPIVNEAWEDAKLEPDPVTQTNRRGTLTFAMGGDPKTFTTQVFINLADNGRLDAMGFAPVCEITAGMQVVDSFFAGHDGAPSQAQQRIQKEGNTFLRSAFPGLDFVKRARIAAGP